VGRTTEISSIYTGTGGFQSVNGRDRYAVLWTGIFRQVQLYTFFCVCNQLEISTFSQGSFLEVAVLLFLSLFLSVFLDFLLVLFSCPLCYLPYRPDTDGTWYFRTTSDDGSLLWLGDTAASGYTIANALVNNGGLHGMRSIDASVPLQAGVDYHVRMQFTENTGGDNMIFSYRRPGSSSWETNGLGLYYPPSSMECDSEGCWLLVLQYWHQGGTNPELKLRTLADGLPELAPSSYSLGSDGSLKDQETWGHLTPKALKDLQISTGFTKLRFYAKSSAHSRVIHFKTDDTAVLNYFTTGTGSVEPPIEYSLYSDHTAIYIPQQVTNYWSGMGDFAMTGL
jgi:hypothetical protein